MKSVNRLHNASIPETKMNQVKGGTNPNVVVIETQIDITTVNATGAVNLLYCDRRRKLVNC